MRFIKHKGEKLTLSQWANKAGISRSNLHWRLKRGWKMEKALKKTSSKKYQDLEQRITKLEKLLK